MSAKKKLNSKSVAHQKRKQRRMLTLFRVFRYGFDSFVRNSWLSVAATAVMTITLLIIFSAFVTQNILTDTIGTLRDRVDMSIYLKTDTSDSVGKQLKSELQKLSSVRSVVYCSASCARSQFAKDNISDASALAALNEATNKNPATLRVVVSDINDTSQLEKFVNTNSILKDHLNPDYKPSIDLVTVYLVLVLLAMVTVGAIIGIISSMLATRRYLKP